MFSGSNKNSTILQFHKRMTNLFYEKLFSMQIKHIDNANSSSVKHCIINFGTLHEHINVVRLEIAHLPRKR